MRKLKMVPRIVAPYTHTMCVVYKFVILMEDNMLVYTEKECLRFVIPLEPTTR